MGCTMRIVTLCREHALVLTQISKESEQFKEQAAYLAQRWLVLAALGERFALKTQDQERSP
jgi:hypothetical protein